MVKGVLSSNHRRWPLGEGPCSVRHRHQIPAEGGSVAQSEPSSVRHAWSLPTFRGFVALNRVLQLPLQRGSRHQEETRGLGGSMVAGTAVLSGPGQPPRPVRSHTGRMSGSGGRPNIWTAHARRGSRRPTSDWKATAFAHKINLLVCLVRTPPVSLWSRSIWAAIRPSGAPRVTTS